MQGQEMAVRWAIMRIRERLETVDTNVTDGDLGDAYAEAKDIILAVYELSDRINTLRADTQIMRGVSNV
jgi:hypothetical protein